MKGLTCLKLILFVLLATLAVFSLFSCKKALNTKLTAPESVSVDITGTYLPKIELNGKVCFYSEFRYENQDGFVYVYDGRIYYTETAPKSFETTLKLIYKKDESITHEIKVIRKEIKATEISIEITSYGVYPGEPVEFAVKAEPEGVYLKDVCITVDKMQYVDGEIEGGEKGSFILSEDTPLGEKIKLTANLDNRLSAECEFSVIDQIIEISEPAQMELLRMVRYGYFRLTSNIDMIGYDWTPIYEFAGILDGDGYTISGLEVEYSENNYFGMLFNINFGKIKNLKVENCISHYATAFDIDRHGVGDEISLKAGVVCGINCGVLENILVQNCELKELRLGSTNSHKYYSVIAGSLCGVNCGTVSRCGAIGNKITGYSASAYKMAYSGIAGLIGHNDNYVEYSYAYSNDLKSYCYGVFVEKIDYTDVYSRTSGFAAQSGGGTFYQCVAANNKFDGSVSGTREDTSDYIKSSFLTRSDGCDIVDCYALYEGIKAVDNLREGVVTDVSSLSLASCIKLSSEIWTEQSGYLIIKHDWRQNGDE